MRRQILLPLTAAAVLAAPATASADFQHTVSSGESLSSVAAADGLSVAQLAAANGISPGSQLVVGTSLAIPPQSGSAGVLSSGVASTASSGTATSGDGDADADDVAGGSSAAAAPSISSGTGGYVVQPGDTLSAIAARQGISVSSLAAANGLDPNGILVAGTVLNGSGSGASSSQPVSLAVAANASAATSQPVGAAAQGYAGGPPYPTPETVTASQVGSIASANGVSPSLAAAIGYQESGFNNDLVSSAGARGVMQILPGTWDWIQRTLAAGTLAPASAADNVRGGVLLLHSLLNATGGDPTMAAAGYYQGLPSVQANGMYSTTQNYVNSVMALRQRFGGG